MIQNVDLDTSGLAPGKSRPLTVYSTAAPIMIEIKCFVSTPPPPGFKPCSECGTIKVNSGHRVTITASATVFRSSSGSLEVAIVDADGDRRRYSIGVGVEVQEPQPA